MGTKHVVFDDALKFWEASAYTNFAQGTVASAVLSMGTAGAYLDKVNPPEIWIDWPGLDSAGAATVVLKILSDTNATPTTVLWTSRTFTLAEAQAAFDTNEYYRLPLPISEISTYLMLQIVIAAADLSAGTLYAALGSPER